MLEPEDPEEGEEVPELMAEEQILASYVKELLHAKDYDQARHQGFPSDQAYGQPESEGTRCNPEDVSRPGLRI